MGLGVHEDPLLQMLRGMGEKVDVAGPVFHLHY